MKSVVLVLVLVIGVFAQAVDFGVNMSLSLPSEGSFESNNYWDSGWYDNTIYDPPTPYDVTSIVSEWEVTPDLSFGGGGYIGYWFNKKLGIRLNFDLVTNAGIETKAKVNYIYDNLISIETRAVGSSYPTCDRTGELETYKINPGIQYSFGKDPRKGLSVFAGPAVFIDNFRIAFDVPYILTWDDPSYYYISPMTALYFSEYDESKTSLGLSAALFGRLPLSPFVYIEGGLFADFGSMPCYSEVEEYIFLNSPDDVNTIAVEVSNESSSFIREIGFKLGIGLYLGEEAFADSDGDGVWDEFDLCPDTPPRTPVDERGCPRKAVTKMSESEVESEFEAKGVFVSNQIFFEFNSDEITPESYPILDDIGRILQRHRDWKLEVAGHTDAIGTDEYNDKLSLKRAKAVKNYLVENFNLVPENLSAMGYGESKPIATNDTDEGRAQNRRVEFRILK